jgi:hypothetical protein
VRLGISAACCDDFPSAACTLGLGHTAGAFHGADSHIPPNARLLPRNVEPKANDIEPAFSFY